MDHINEFVDERQKAWCVHCGQSIVDLETSRDHVPSKSLLLNPHPSNLPVVQVCKSCNAGFSLDEEYLVAFLGSVLAGSTKPDRHDNPYAARILQRSPKLRARIEAAKSQYRTRGGEVRTVWKPEAARIERVIVKNARGHVLFEIGEPMLEAPKSVRFTPLESLTTEQRTDFEQLDFGSGWPEVGSRMMTRLLTGEDLTDGWIVVQDDVYRYAVAQTGVTLVRMVLFEYLATEVCWD
jgi:hypothetical protein